MSLTPIEKTFIVSVLKTLEGLKRLLQSLLAR